MSQGAAESATPPVEPADAAIEFLDRLRPGGPWVLTAIVPDGGAQAVTITALNADAVRAFIREHDGRRNLYYSANPTMRALTSKASKKDIAAAEYLFADLDPRDNETSADAKARYLERLATFKQPTFIVDSGNGLQALWRLSTAMGPDRFAEVEARTKATILALGGPPGTQNVDRILRLPGTTNLPNEKKRKAGRVPCATALLSYSDIAHPFDAFLVPEAPKGCGGSPKLTSNPVPLLTVDVDELPCSDRIHAMIRTGEDTENPAVPFADCRSERAFTVLVALAAAGCDDATIAAVMFDPTLPIGEHVREQRDSRRCLARQIAKARQRVEEDQELFDSDGRPVIRIKAGDLSKNATRGEDILQNAGVELFRRSGKLVRPIVEDVEASHGRRTKVAQLVPVEQTYLRDILGRHAAWVKLDSRGKSWVAAQPSPHFLE